MKLNKMIGAIFILVLSSHSFISYAADESCSELFDSPIQHHRISSSELISHASQKIREVAEFELIRNVAQSMGIHVWMFGDTASTFLHYVKDDLATHYGQKEIHPLYLDYHFHHIFRSTQTIELITDASPEILEKYHQIIHQNLINNTKITSFLQNPSPHLQRTDSYSLGRIEITESNSEHFIIHSNSIQTNFVDDLLNNRITYLGTDEDHQKKSEILSILRTLAKAFQYDLKISESSLERIRKIIREFDPQTISNGYEKTQIAELTKELVNNSVNLESAIHQLDELGLRKKLISLGNPREKETFAWWLNREPLKSHPLGESATGRTAQQLRIREVAHKTNQFSSSESITHALTGEANVFISRKNAVGEAASYGDGFYTYIPKKSFHVFGHIVRFEVHPDAKEGSDFIFHGTDIVIFRNKKALKVIPNDSLFDLSDLVFISESSEPLNINLENLRQLETQRRRLNRARIIFELQTLISSKNSNMLDQLHRIAQALQNPKMAPFLTPETRDWAISYISTLLASKPNP